MKTPTQTHLIKSILALFTSLLCHSNALAQILTESFPYGSTSQAITTLTSNWTAHSGTGSNAIQYLNAGLISPTGYPVATDGAIGFAGGSGSREDVNRSITTQSSGTLYAAALVNLSATGSDYFFHFNIVSFVGRIFTSNSAGNLRFGVSKTGTATMASNNFAFNTTYLMVLKYEFVNGAANDVVSLWILSEPSATEADAGVALSNDAVGTDPASLVCLGIRQGTSSATGTLDEIRLANTWEEAVGTSVWNGSTWSGGTPTSTSNIKLSSHLILSGDLSCRNLNIEPGILLQMGSRHLTVNGSISGSGTLSGTNNAQLTLNGTAGTLNFASGNQILKNLSLGANASATLGSSLSLCAGTNFGTLTLGNNSQLNTGGHLVLKSDANGSARIATLGSGALLNGEISVERYLPARRSYRFLSSAVTTTTGIDDAWQQNTHITGSGTGFDASASNNPSLFYFNQSNQEWVAINNTQMQNLQQGTGYRIMVRGDRSIDLNNSMATPTTCILSAKGTHTPGDKTYTSSSTPALFANTNGYTLLGNPFPSAINWNTLQRTNLSSTYFTWRAQGGSNGKGAYVNYNASGQISSDGNINSVIGSGSAFVVQTTGSSPSLTIAETDKVSSEQGSQILGKTLNPQLRLSIFEKDSLFVDALVLYEHPESSFSKDAFDSEKWLNPGISFYSRDSLQNKYSIQGIPHAYHGLEVPLFIENCQIQTYQMQIQYLGKFESKPFLFDRFLDRNLEIDTQQLYEFDVTQNQASAATNRFTIGFGTISTAQSEWQKSYFTIYPNPVNEKLYVNTPQGAYKNLEYKIYNLLGKVYLQGMLSSDQAISVGSLPPGIYLIELLHSGERSTQKFVHL